MGRRLTFGLVLTAVILAAACGTETASTPTAVPPPAVTPAATVPAAPTSAPAPTFTPAPTATPVATPTSVPITPPALVAAQVTTTRLPDLGTVLADAGGRTLYGFANDEENVSRCTGGCALTWPPLLTVGDPYGGEGVAAGRLGTITRDDGSTQVTYKGRPLYRFSQDEKPGDAKGHNQGGVWSVVSSEAPVAVSLTLGSSKDATLYQDPAGVFANGAGEYLFTGNINQGLSRRALIGFDLTDSIPPGATIKSVRLTLNMSRTQAGAGVVELRRVLAGWGEGVSDPSANEGGGTFAGPGDVTWIHRKFDTTRWQSPGGDFSPEASASVTVDGAGTYTWGPTPQLVADVQAWLDDPSANFGWLLLGNESGNQTTKRFDSRENLEDKNRPKLTVEFASGASEGPKPGSPAEEEGAY